MAGNGAVLTGPLVINFDISVVEHLEMITQVFCTEEKCVSSVEVKTIWGERYDLLSRNRNGWKALWIPQSDMCDMRFRNILVKVLNVNCDSLCASICVLDASVDITSEQHALLVELFPVDEEFPFIDDIAKYLHNLRFFYSHVWLPWEHDAGVEVEENWVNDCLVPRLDLFRDMLACKIPPVLVTHIKNSLTEGKGLYKKLQNLREDLRVHKNTDKERFFESSEAEKLLLLEIMDTEGNFREKRNEIKLLENAVYRASMIEKYQTTLQIPEKSFHIVSRQTSCKNFRHLIEKLEPNIPKSGFVLFHASLEEAVVTYNKHDTVYIFPGTYLFNYPSLKCGIIKGHPNSSEVTLMLKNELSVSLENAAIYEDLTIKAVCRMAGCVIKNGDVTLKNCVLLGNGENVGLKVLPGCVLRLWDCEIENFAVAVDVYPKAHLYVNGCAIRRCNVGIKVQVGGEVFSPADQTK